MKNTHTLSTLQHQIILQKKACKRMNKKKKNKQNFLIIRQILIEL